MKMKNEVLVKMMMEAEKLGWEVLIVYKEKMEEDFYHVVVHREGAPFPHLAYSSHIYGGESESFFSGLYDLTLEEALEATRRRAGYDKLAVED